MSMNLDIKYWFPAKNDKWIAEKEQALACLKQGLLDLKIDNAEPFIRIAIQELIRDATPKDLDYPSDKGRKLLNKLKRLVKSIDGLGLELRLPLKEMYGVEFPKINPSDVVDYLNDDSCLDLDELHPLNNKPKKRIAREVLPHISNATTYEKGQFRKAVSLIYKFLEIQSSEDRSCEDHSCRDAIKPKDIEAISAQKWRDEKIDKENM